MSKKKLTAMQQVFCYEYIARHGNGQAAAEAAGCPPKNARVQAYKWLTIPYIQKEISRLAKVHYKKMDCKISEVIRELAIIGYARMDDFIKWNENGQVSMKSRDEMGEKTAAIKEIKITKRTVTLSKSDPDSVVEETETTLKLHDKVKPLEILKSVLIDKNDEPDDPAANVVLNLNGDLQSSNASDLARRYSALLGEIRGGK